MYTDEFKTVRTKHHKQTYLWIFHQKNKDEVQTAMAWKNPLLM
jgi:hypothetical protein